MEDADQQDRCTRGHCIDGLNASHALSFEFQDFDVAVESFQ